MQESLRNILPSLRQKHIPSTSKLDEIWKESGEDIITPNSWVMSDMWDTKKGCIQHFVTVPF